MVQPATDVEDEVAAIGRGAVAHRGERRADTAGQNDIGQAFLPVWGLCTCRADEAASTDEQGAENGEESSA